MAVSDLWHRTLVYFGMADEADDYDDYDDDRYDEEPERDRDRDRRSPAHDDLERSYRERPNVRRLGPAAASPTSTTSSPRSRRAAARAHAVGRVAGPACRGPPGGPQELQRRPADRRQVQGDDPGHPQPPERRDRPRQAAHRLLQRAHLRPRRRHAAGGRQGLHADAAQRRGVGRGARPASWRRASSTSTDGGATAAGRRARRGGRRGRHGPGPRGRPGAGPPPASPTGWRWPTPCPPRSRRPWPTSAAGRRPSRRPRAPTSSASRSSRRTPPRRSPGSPARWRRAQCSCRSSPAGTSTAWRRRAGRRPGADHAQPGRAPRCRRRGAGDAGPRPGARGRADRLPAAARGRRAHCRRACSRRRRRWPGAASGLLALVAEGLEEGAAAAGLARPQARELTAAVLAGTAALLADGTDPALVRQRVSSPAGATLPASPSWSGARCAPTWPTRCWPRRGGRPSSEAAQPCRRRGARSRALARAASARPRRPG